MKQWQRPKTTRRYIHPPMAERMFTMWREGKIVFGENELAVRSQYYDLISSGMWFLDGEGNPFDFHDARLFQREDGIPVHGLGFKLGEVDLGIEAFADFERVPACHIKVKVENPTFYEASCDFGFMLRTGNEGDVTGNNKGLIFASPDVYQSYAPLLDAWRDMPSTWRLCGNVFTDGTREILAQGDIDFSFSAECGVAKTAITLLPGESREVVFTFDIGKAKAVDYEASKALCVKAWEGELAKINKISDSVRNNAPVFRAIKNLTVQLLQCFTRPKGVDFVLARQGGLQRQVWTYETMPVLEALERLGDFDSYIEPIIDVYFNRFATESGEIVPLAIPWAMATGNVLYSFGTYAKSRGDKAFFEKYRDTAYKAFLWMKNLRASVKAEPGVVEGLFPPLRSCDDELVFQSWCSTDNFNIKGIAALAEAFEFFGDKDSGEVRAELESYRARMLELWAGFRDAQTGKELKIPFSPGVPDEVIMRTYHFSYPISYMAEGLDFPMEDALRVIDTYTELGMIKPDGTLYDRMPDRKVEEGAENGSSLYNFDENGKCIVWYVCCHEYLWFKYFMRHGDRERCKKVLEGVFRFAMTDEYYMCERYNQRDPYFAPWSPNASANGRTINMLLDYYS